MYLYVCHTCYLYVCQVKRCIQEESVRIRRYLHPFTYQRIELECHSWLVCDENVDFINDTCSEIVQREQWKGDQTFIGVEFNVPQDN